MKVFVYVVIVTVMMIMLQLVSMATGLNLAPGVSGLLEALGLLPGTDFSTGSLFNYLFGENGRLLAVAIGVGVFASFFTQSKVENFIILPIITGILATFLGTFASLMKYSYDVFPVWISMIILIIFGGLTSGFVVSLYEHFRGTD